MRTTQLITLNPDAYYLMAPVERLEQLQIKGQKAIRLHYGDVYFTPRPDTDDYILTTNYEPNPIKFDTTSAKNGAEVIYARADGDKPVECVAVWNNAEIYVKPDADQLPVAKVGVPYSVTFNVPEAPSIDTWRSYPIETRTEPLYYDSVPDYDTETVPPREPLIPNSTLPPGMALGTDGVLSGTPTTAGTYTFEVYAFTPFPGFQIPMPTSYALLVLA